MPEHPTRVGIVTFNRASVLPKAIASALLQRPEVGLTILDDASTDKTPSLATNFPAVKWIRGKKRSGLIAARNYLMQTTPEPYFVSLDDDAWFLHGDEIALAVRHLDADEDVGAVAFDILSPDRPATASRARPYPVAMFIGCGHVIRLSAARMVGLYVEGPGGYGGEEKDMSLRLLDAGFRIDFLPGVHVWHERTPISRSIPQQHSSGVCNDLVMTLRRSPRALLPLALPFKFVRHFQFALRNGLMAPFLRGVALFIRSFPKSRQSRRSVKFSTLRHFMKLSHAK